VRAAAFFEYGPADVLRYAEVADPHCGPDEVLVRVQACGVNHSDLDSRAGTSRWPFALPMVLGAEFVGTVVEVGPSVSTPRTGDLVTALVQFSCGRCPCCARWRSDLCGELEIFGTTRWGGYGELVAVPARVAVVLQPDDDPLAIAASQCTVSTAWHMVNRLAVLRPGDLVLVPSAAGGVASALVQCAKRVGATVVGTVGAPEKAEQVRALGADEVISYRVRDLAAALLEATGGRRFDAVLDTVGGDRFGAHLSVLREDGCLVICGAHGGEIVSLDLIPLFREGLRILGFRVAAPDELLAAISQVRNGEVKVPIAATFPLSDAASAHRFLDRRTHVGKVLLVAP
jgi:NADPH:quinone reductase-like Zn-dependent oxidoreductase